MTPDDIRQQIELKVVEMIKAKLTDGTMTEERSQQISQRVLDILKPGMKFKELYKAIFMLDDPCPELSAVVLPVAQDYEKRITGSATKKVQEYIKTGKYDAATKLAKDVAGQNVDLEWIGSAKPS